MAGASPATAGDKLLRDLATAGAIGNAVAAGGITLYEDDRNGLLMLAETEAMSFGLTEGLKYAVNERRPNGGNYSFPSGHTSIAFASAGYLHARYGWKVGLPFELVALAVGISRVQTRDHHWYDVVAGAAIGEGSAYLFTRRLTERVRVSANGDSQGGGVQLSFKF